MYPGVQECFGKLAFWEEKFTGIVVVVLLEAQHELRAMGEEFLLQGSESRTFSCSDPAEKNTSSVRKHLHRSDVWRTDSRCTSVSG